MDPTINIDIYTVYLLVCLSPVCSKVYIHKSRLYRGGKKGGIIRRRSFVARERGEKKRVTIIAVKINFHARYLNMRDFSAREYISETFPRRIARTR